MDLLERFLNYVKFDTQSSEEGTACPSTDKQMVFARNYSDGRCLGTILYFFPGISRKLLLVSFYCKRR